jgi:uroporphyrin-III C-methyltransferase/precorrin-2 dehydrogenase/sirohydrochlorin ferrochelatase
MLIPFENKTVYLIGGGCGDPRYLTLEADSLLQQADTIVHDMYLESMQERYSQAEWIHVGKKKGYHVQKQSEINDLLVKLALEGKRIVRLKSGDPLYFARSSEEIEALKLNKIPFKIIPGISSPQMLGAKLSESLTHRYLTRSISFWSGYWDKNISPVGIPNTEAHIIFMGLSEIESIIDKMLEGGKSPKTKLIAASNLGRPNEKILISTLENAKVDIHNSNLENPTLFAIGLEHIQS